MSNGNNTTGDAGGGEAARPAATISSPPVQSPTSAKAPAKASPAGGNGAIARALAQFKGRPASGASQTSPALQDAVADVRSLYAYSVDIKNYQQVGSVYFGSERVKQLFTRVIADNVLAQLAVAIILSTGAPLIIHDASDARLHPASREHLPPQPRSRAP